MKYIKLFMDKRKYFELLTDEQRGKMLLAMIDYAESGSAPDYTGVELAVWMSVSEMIDSGREAYDRMVEAGRASGKQGGRPRKARVIPLPQGIAENPKGFTETPSPQEQEQEQEQDKEQEQEYKERNKRTRAKAFVRPTLEQVKAYIAEKGLHVDGQRWFDYYESNGWRVGRNPMKDWQATVRNWNGNGFGSGQASTPRRVLRDQDYEQRQCVGDVDSGQDIDAWMAEREGVL